jgi:pilus assembly protein CpaF
MEGNIITTQEIFTFVHKGLDDQGKVRGSFHFQGVRPRFLDKFAVYNISVNQEIFNPDKAVEV